MGEYRVAPLERLIEQFERFPSVGHKTASRLAYHVLSMTEEDINSFSQTVIQAHKNIRHCKICCNLTDTEICSVCSDESRDKSIICVVEDFRDVIALERTREFHADAKSALLTRNPQALISALRKIENYPQTSRKYCPEPHLSVCKI